MLIMFLSVHCLLMTLLNNRDKNNHGTRSYLVSNTVCCLNVKDCVCIGLSTPCYKYRLIIKNRSSFLLKRNGIQLSAERNNLTNLNSFKYSGIANKKVCNICILSKHLFTT